MTKDAWVEDAMELSSVVCAAYKMGCDQTREVYQKRIEKLEAALREIINKDSFSMDWAIRTARKALDAK